MAVSKKNTIFANKTMTIMKRLSTAFVLLLVCHLLQAAPVSREQAQQVALQFMGSQPRMTANTHRAKLSMWQPVTVASEEPSYYVFNIDEGAGFVIVSGDDRMEPVLGYSDNGSFDANHLPDHVRAWLSSYTDQLNYLNAHPQSQPMRAGATSMAAIKPMLNCQWYQKEPYNNLCEIDPITEKRCVTGCVATAMAQIMFYWKYPAKTKATIPLYTTTTRSITTKSYAPTVLNWSYMKNTYKNVSSQTFIDAVATLMVLCGCSIEMDYTSSVSAATSAAVPSAMRTYFGYASSIHKEDRNHYQTLEWNKLIYNELAAGRPVLYSGQSTGGGHAFVVDGCDGNGMFHVNWGWDGEYNGYFLLSALDTDGNDGVGASTTSDGYNFAQDALIGITPYEGQAEVAPVCMTTYGMKLTGGTTTTRQSNKTFNIGLQAAMFNDTGTTHTFDIGLGVYDKDDNLLEVFCQAQGEVKKAAGWYEYIFDNNYSNFGASLANGNYTIKIVSKVGSANWHPNFGSNKFFVTVNINGNKATFTAPNLKLGGTITPQGVTEQYAELKVSAKITNSGTSFSDDIFLMSDQTILTGAHVELENGQSTTVSLLYVPQNSGKTVLDLVYFNGTEYVSFASTTVTINPGSTTKNLDGSLVIPDTEKSGNYYQVKSSTVQVNAHVQNLSTGVYSNNILICLHKKNSEGKLEVVMTHAKKVNIVKNGTLDFSFEFTDLVDNSTYAFSIQYITDNLYKIAGDPIYFKTAFDNSKVDGVLMTNDSVVPVYSLDGRKVGRTKKGEAGDMIRSLPKGIYIIDGKKIAN